MAPDPGFRTVFVRPLDAAAFAPFGEVIEVPREAGRVYFERALANLRPGAWPSLSISRREDVQTLPLVARQMERHEFSSQSFVAIEAGRWLIAVAPDAENGGPDASKLQAFVVGPGQGVTYGANVWHHPFTVLDQPARFAILMWRTGRAGDDEFVEVPEFEVALP